MKTEKEKIYKDFVENYDADIISFEKGYEAGKSEAIKQVKKLLKKLKKSNEGYYGGIACCEYGCIEVVEEKLGELAK